MLSGSAGPKAARRTLMKMRQGGDSQNYLCKFVGFFVTLGLKILRLFRLKVLFEADIIKGKC